jgi:acyl-CoA thioesterase
MFVAQSFDSAWSLVPEGAGRFSWSIPEGWRQGRGAYGGLVIGALTQAASAIEPERDRRVRAVTAELAAPALTGPATIVCEPIRRGRVISMTRVRLVQGGDELVQAVVTFGRGRPAPERSSVMAPVMRPFAEVPELHVGPPLAPEFALQLDYRMTGAMPYTKSEPRCEGWVVPRAPCARDAAFVVAMSDAYWPSVIVMLEAPRAFATIVYTLELLVDPTTLGPDAPLYHRGSTESAGEGYVQELRELFTQSGVLVARNHQTIAVLG